MSSAAAKLSSSTPEFVFTSLSSCRKQKFSLIEKVFVERVAPLWGNQDEVLSDIRSRTTRKTEILQSGETDIGFVSYKREPVDFSYRGEMKKCLELSALCLFDPAQHGKKRYGSFLYEHVAELARRMDASGIVYKAPVTEGVYLEFLQRKGFTVEKTSVDQKALTLFKELASKEVETRGASQAASDSAPPTAKRVKRDDAPPPPPPPPQRVVYASPAPNPGGRHGSFSSSSATSPFFSPPPHPSSGGVRMTTPIHLGPGQHQLTLKKEYIHPIRTGIKSVEGRIASGAPARFKVGDQLRFFYPQDERDDVTVRISQIDRYNSFREMLEATGFRKCIPAARTLEDAVRVYESIPGFADRARQNGVLAIHLSRGV